MRQGKAQDMLRCSAQPLGALWRLVLLAAAIVAIIAASCCLDVPKAHAASVERYALLADTHLGLPNNTAYEEAEEALYWASEYGNLKAVCVAGDLTDRGAPESFDQWEFLCASIVPDAKRIQAMGDHDTGKMGAYLAVDRKLTLANGNRYFRQTNGGSLTSYSEFAYANVMTVGGVRGNGYSVITNNMLKKLNTQLLKTARQGKMAIVICHYPYYSGALNLRAKLMGILRSYPNVVYVSGDKHQYPSDNQCEVARPSSKATPYRRDGFDEATLYPFRSIGVNACSTYRSGDYSYADLLRITKNGVITLQKHNITKGRVDKTWRFKQAKSSVSVKCVPVSGSYSKSTVFKYRVTFSNGKAYGGLKSGETFSLRAGKSKKFSNIPAGVLVRVKAVRVPAGWSKPKSQVIEVTSNAQSLEMKTSRTKVSTSKASVSKSAGTQRLRAA